MSDTPHLQIVRQEMPAATKHLYFNAGTFGPIPTCVQQAMQQIMEEDWQHGRLSKAAFQRSAAIAQSARQGVAQLLHAEEQEITLTSNTGEGLNIVSYGINWYEGDEIITTNHEHISALGPLYQLRDRYAAAIKYADLGPQAQRPAIEAIQELVTERTRLILLSHVTWTTGAVLDIKPVIDMGKEHHIPVLIDGAQSAGAIPIDVKELAVDFYAIPMQKWLCGPTGAGALYVSQEMLHQIAPTYVGYMSIDHTVDAEWPLLPNAQRFELGGRSSTAVAGQDAALNWLANVVGYEWLFARISQLHSYAYQALSAIAELTLLTPQAGASGLLSFSLAGVDDKEAVKVLQEKYNIYIRNIPSMHALRVSTGFYNTEQEIDTLIQALREIVRASR